MFSNQALKKLILPLIVEQLLVMMVGMVDTIMVSYAGEAAVSGVSLVDMINYLIITIFAAVGAGGAVIVSQYLGNRDTKNANLSASQLYTITILISTVITGICLVFHQEILQLLFGSIEEDVMEASITYFIITALSFPFLGMYNSGSALFRSMQKTNTTMYISLLSNAVNILGNAIGIFVLHAGVAGVAVPTLLARIVAAVLIVILSYKKKNPVYVVNRQILSWNRDAIRRILRIAIPNGIENGLFALGKVLVVSIVSLFGTVQIASNGVANSINQISIIVLNSVNLAMVTVVGQCVGAREYGQAEYYTKKLMKISYISTAILGSLVLLVLPFILRFYELSPETYHYTCILITIHNVLAMLIAPLSFNLANSLRAAGDVRFTMYTGVISMVIFRLGSAVLFAIVFDLGVVGVWLAMGMDWLARSIAFVIRYRSGKWKAYRAI